MDIKRIIDYEQGNLAGLQVVELFQELIDTGLAWELQGHYGRTAATLLKAGACVWPTPDPNTEPKSRKPCPLDTDPADNSVYAMHGIDDGPPEKHVGAIWGQEPE